LPWCGSGLIPPYRYGGLHTGKERVTPRSYTNDESGSDPRKEMVPPTQTNSINTDEISRGSIPVYSTSSSDFKSARFQINPDLVIFSTDYYDLTDAPEAISQPLTINFCPSCCMCSLLCFLHFSNFSDLNDLLQSTISEYIPRKGRVARRQTWWEKNMGEIRKLLNEQQRLRQEMYRYHNGKAAFKDYKSYVQREIRRFEFNYRKQICDDFMAKANAALKRSLCRS